MSPTPEPNAPKPLRRSFALSPLLNLSHQSQQCWRRSPKISARQNTWLSTGYTALLRGFPRPCPVTPVSHRAEREPRCQYAGTYLQRLHRWMTHGTSLSVDSFQVSDEAHVERAASGPARCSSRLLVIFIHQIDQCSRRSSRLTWVLM